MESVTFVLKQDINRLVTEAQGVADSIILEAGQKLETDVAEVIAVLDANPAVERGQSAPVPTPEPVKAETPDPAPEA